MDDNQRHAVVQAVASPCIFGLPERDHTAPSAQARRAAAEGGIEPAYNRLLL